jgi:hypothetical protein
MKHLLYIAMLVLATSVQAQISLDLSKSYLWAPVGTTDKIGISHARVSGYGSYVATLKFNPATNKFDIDSVSPSQTDENTESLAGVYTCRLYSSTLPIFSTTIKPVGQDLLFGAGLQYRFLGTSGANVWKYTVTFEDGGKYLLSMVKESTTSTYAVLGYVQPGTSELDLANSLKCSKIE